jgi:hypothetical protein
LKHRNRLAAICAATAIAGAAFAMAACDDDGGSEEDEADVQAAIDNFNQAMVDGDAELLSQVMTEDGALEVFQVTLEDAAADPSLFATGEEGRDDFVVSEIEVDGDEAKASGSFQSEAPGFDSTPVLVLVKEDDAWKVNSLEMGEAEEPEGATTVEMTLDEFSFEFDETDITSGSTIFLEVENAGEQPHHVVFIKLEGVTFEEALAADGEIEGVTDLGFAGNFAPGDSGSIAVNEPLQPGNYVFACFLPDVSVENPEEQQLHVELGMFKEFTVQ